MKSASPRATPSSLEELLNGAGGDTSGNDRGRQSDGPSAAARTARSRRVSLFLRLACIGLLLLAVAAAGWWVAGGRWMIVATPSMGRAAPVGTLVFTEHVTAAQVHVGDVISFHAPIGTREIYTHRVISIDATGRLHTRGDINGAADPWALHTSDLVGKVVARWWGFGWLIRALPLLLVGGAMLWLLTRRLVSVLWRWPLRVFGMSLLASIAAFLLKPFVNVVVVSTTSQVGSSTATLVSTGILPIRVEASGGAHLDLVDGQIGAVTASGTPGPHGYEFSSALHLSLMWWIALVLVWLSPLLLCLLIPPAPTPPAPTPPSPTSAATSPPARASSGGPGSPHGHHRLRPPASRRWVAGISVAIAAFLGFVPATQSAFAAKIVNSTDTAASATYFTCAAAGLATVANGGYFAYPLNETSFSTAADVSGNSRPGTYQVTGVTPGTFTSSSPGPCPRDLPSRAVTVAGGVSVLGVTLGNAYIAGGGAAVSNPVTFSEEIWFKTSTAGGRLIGFGNNSTGGPANLGTSNNYDRQIYMSTNGQLNFGVNPGAIKVITSGPGLADNNWHQVVATLSSAGQFLYVDGALVKSDLTTRTAEVYSGFWRVGYDSLAGWPGITTNYNFNGTLSWASVYTTALSAQQVMEHYRAGTA